MKSNKRLFKKSILAVTLITFSTTIAQVGINNTSPTETFDVAGTTRIRNLPANGSSNIIYTKPDGSKSTAIDQAFTATRTVTADKNGVLGYVDGIPAQAVTESTGSTIIKTIYPAIAPDQTKTISIGGMTFRIDNTWGIQMALTSSVNKTIYVGMNQQFASNGFEYANYTHVFTTANATTYRNVANNTSNDLSNYELNILHIVDVTENVYYRVTFYVSGPTGTSSQKAFVIVAEKF